MTSNADGTTTSMPPTSVGPGSESETDPEPTTTEADPPWSVALEVDESVGAFLSVWGPSATNIYVVGGQQPVEPGPSIPAMYRWDGAEWTSLSFPDTVYALNWVYGVGEDRFAVGDFGTVIHRLGDDDATPWEEQECDTNLNLWGVWGATADDVWAVGGDGFMRPPVMCHYDGSAWEIVDLPDSDTMSRALFKIWGADADHIWAVGHRGLIFYWDGSAWAEQPTGTSLDLISLWGTGPDNVLAVGGRSDAVVLRYDGASWTPMEMPGFPGLNGTWMAPDGLATIVGSMGRIDTVAPGTLDATPDDMITNLALHAVFGTPEGTRFAAGGSLDLSPPYTGIILVR